jgi:hypothetical protein
LFSLVSLDAIVHSLLHVALAARDLPRRIGPDALVAILAVGIRVAIALTAAKRVHGTGPGPVVAPVDQVLVVDRDLLRVDAIIGLLALGRAGTTKDGVICGVAITFQTDQIAGAVVAVIAISLASAQRILVLYVLKHYAAVAASSADGSFGRGSGWFLGRRNNRFSRGFGRGLDHHRRRDTIIDALRRRATASGNGRLSLGVETLETGGAVVVEWKKKQDVGRSVYQERVRETERETERQRDRGVCCVRVFLCAVRVRSCYVPVRVGVAVAPALLQWVN